MGNKGWNISTRIKLTTQKTGVQAHNGWHSCEQGKNAGLNDWRHSSCRRSPGRQRWKPTKPGSCFFFVRRSCLILWLFEFENMYVQKSEDRFWYKIHNTNTITLLQKSNGEVLPAWWITGWPSGIIRRTIIAKEIPCANSVAEKKTIDKCQS